MKRVLHLFLVLLLLFVGGGCMSAETQIGKISFGDSGVHFLSVPFTFTDNLNNSWTIDAQNKIHLYCKGFKESDGGGVQIGSIRKSASKITFTMTLPDAITFKNVVAIFSGYQTTTGDITITVGGDTIGIGQLNGTNDVDARSAKEASGKDLTITVSNIKSGVIIKSILYSYEDGTTASSETATISAAQWATYVTKHAVDFNNAKLKAYTAKFDAAANSITLSPVKEVPANTAVVLKGDAGTYSMPCLASAVSLTDNDLTFKDSEYKVTSDKTIYVLAKQGDVCGFYPLANGETLPANKGYIYIPNPSSAKSVYRLNNFTTGIRHAVKAGTQLGFRYNLVGQRVSSTYKGVVIENGKKFVVK